MFGTQYNLRGRPANAIAGAVVVAMLALLGAPGSSMAAARAAERPTMEYRLKAAFIYHFLHFTDWPPGAFDGKDSPIVVAIVGDDPFDGALHRALHDKRIAGREVLLKHFTAPPPPPPPAVLNECHLLFVSPSLGRDAGGDVLRQVRGTPVLTVSDDDAFTRAGGVMRLLVEGDKIRFEVNRSAARRQQLKMRAKLLKLARLCDEDDEEELTP